MAKHRKKPKKKKAPQKKIRKKKTSKINPPAFDTEIQKRYKALHHYPMRKKIDIK